uniref:Uncharacterized protein n=1 Tax=Hemiselmis andersenii TaxID=464988 RepID=A0A6U4WFG2_HEMAN|mmetsp:Transcript_31497/g.76778  ORF Transcript_31497/g.76778 Transcript_31497/m.76778 type:complete len:119 (+) Transcript_31497:26-382(+)
MVAVGRARKELAGKVVAALIGLGLVVCCVLISQAKLRGERSVLWGISSGGEYEDEHAVTAAVKMAVQTNQTDLITFPDVFNKSLGSIGANIDEAKVAVGEAKSLQESQNAFDQGSDPW